jgi:hypothetical protein
MPSVHGVDRRILEQDHAGRQLHTGTDDVEDIATRARERSQFKSA